MATDIQKPKPLPDRQDIDNGPFWSGTDEGRLQAKQCGACSHYHWPPRLGCPAKTNDTWVLTISNRIGLKESTAPAKALQIIAADNSGR